MEIYFYENPKSSFDKSALKNQYNHFLQSYIWGEFKSHYGFEPVYLLIKSKEKSYPLMMLKRSVPLLGNLYYAPKGPCVDSGFDFSDFAETLRKFIVNIDKKAILVKIEPESNLSKKDLVKYQKSLHDIQVPATIIVKLDNNFSQWLEGLKQKTRYNIKYAAKKGIVVKEVPVNSDNMEIMYKLMLSIGKRSEVFIRPKQYFFNYWRAYSNSGAGRIFFAYLGNQVIAGEYLIFFGKRSYYKDGGSLRKYANTMMSYAIQAEVIKQSFENNITEYDMIGVPRKKDIGPESTHNLLGLFKFKSMFEPDITEYTGTLDLILSPMRFAIWKRLERYVIKFYKVYKKNLFW